MKGGEKRRWREVIEGKSLAEGRPVKETDLRAGGGLDKHHRKKSREDEKGHDHTVVGLRKTSGLIKNLLMRG